MLSIIISDFEPIRNYIKNSIKSFYSSSSIVTFNNIKESDVKKINMIVNDFNNVVIFIDLDKKPYLIGRKPDQNEKIGAISSIERMPNVSIFAIGSEESLEENKNFIINQNIHYHQMLSKPFNGKQLQRFIGGNIAKHNADLTKSPLFGQRLTA